jgi:DNA-binding MarR family transcriptional regulator
MSKKLHFETISVHDTPKQSPGFLLWSVSTSWRASIEALLKTFGLTHPQFVVLATTGWLTKEGASATQAAIGRMAALDRNTISQIIKGLEQKGFVARSASSDARANNVSLTTQGAHIVQKALPAVEKRDAAFFKGLNRKELNALIKTFQKLGQNG